MTLAPVTAKGQSVARRVPQVASAAIRFVFGGRVANANGREAAAHCTSCRGGQASQQRRALADRDGPETRLAEFEAKQRDSEAIPRSLHGGDCRVRAEGLAYWQGRPTLLRDRIAHDGDGDRWRIPRLAP